MHKPQPIINRSATFAVALLSALVFVFSCQQSPRGVVKLSGKIKNPNSDSIVIRNAMRQPIKTVKLDDNGSFNTELEAPTGYYTFFDGKEQATFFIKPGFDISFTLDAFLFDETLKYEGNGSAEGNYLAEKYLLEEGWRDKVSFAYFGKLKEKEFLSSLDSLKGANTGLLEKYNQELSEEFAFLESNTIKFKWDYFLLQYPRAYPYFSKDTTYKASDDYPDVLADLDLSNEKLLEIREYQALVESVVQKAASEMRKDNPDASWEFAYLDALSQKITNVKIKETLAYDHSSYAITETEKLDEFLEASLALMSDTANINSLKRTYDKLIKVQPGLPSPTFAYNDINEQMVSLADLKGKYVYVDVWATWCGPCLGEIPSLKNLEKDFHDKDIEFVSISVDRKQDYDTWKNMVAEKELKGVQLFADNSWQSDFVTAYNIQGIPRFILIDPEGNIVSANADRPSNPKLREQLDKLLM